MMLLCSETKNIRYFSDPPPQKKKRCRDMNSRDMATHTSGSLPLACDLDFYNVDIE